MIVIETIVKSIVKGKTSKFTVSYIENDSDSKIKEIFILHVYKGLLSIEWNERTIHLQPITVNWGTRCFQLRNVHRLGKPELKVEEIKDKLKTLYGIEKKDFAIYCLEILKLYKYIVELTGEYKIERSDDEWSKHTCVQLCTPYSTIEIGSVQGSMSGLSPSIDRMQDLYIKELNIK